MSMPHPTDAKELSSLVFHWTSADKLQKIWRKSWRFRSTLNLIHLFLSNYSKERISNMRIDAAGALVRKEITKFWIQKILQRILNKMRLRDKTRQKDISTHCNPMYFLSCMPLCAQQTVQWVDAMCLLQCKELAARHEKTWNTLEEIMMEIQRSKGIVGDHLDEIFNRLYKEFSAFTELYRFTVLNSESYNASMAKESILCCKDDLMGIDVDPGFTIHGFGTQLKIKIESNMALHTKKLKQLAGANGYRFFEEGQLREKTERNEQTLALNERRCLYFLKGFSNPKLLNPIHEVVHYTFCNVDYASTLKMPSIWQCGRIQQLYEKDLFNRLLKEQSQKAPPEIRKSVQEGLQYIEQSLLNYLEPIPQMYEESKVKFQELSRANKEVLFTTPKAEINLRLMFDTLKYLSFRADFYGQKQPNPLSEIQIQIQGSRWESLFQQKNANGLLTYVPHLRMLLEMLADLVLRITALSVAIELAPYQGNFLQYEKEKVARFIEVQNTTRWLSPFILVHNLDTISKELLQEIHFKATWKLILNEEETQRVQKSFVWPETVHLDIATLLKLEEDIKLVTKYAVAYQVVSALRSNPLITLESFVFEFQHSLSFNDVQLDNWLETNGVSALKRAYLLPLIRMKQNPKHSVFIAVQQRLLQNLMMNGLDATTTTTTQQQHQPFTNEESLFNDWMPSGCKGKRVKIQLLQLIQNNFAIYADRYEEIAQDCIQMNHSAVAQLNVLEPSLEFS